MKYEVVKVTHNRIDSAYYTAYKRLREIGASRGAAVRFMRRFADNIKASGEVATHGGATFVTLKLEDGRMAAGVARCSIEDAFSEKTGVRVAIKAALGIKDVFALRKTVTGFDVRACTTYMGNVEIDGKSYSIGNFLPCSTDEWLILPVHMQYAALVEMLLGMKNAYLRMVSEAIDKYQTSSELALKTVR